ncbi:hypothetical protein H0X06_05145 [Candidatus Dependentiae bacterium]|nr:hypothetical protein [Candidatus Dependentiae bacterium]
MSDKNHTITIFIHATLPLGPFLNIPLVKKYAWCPLGLNSLASIKEDFYLASMAMILCDQDPELFNKEFFYLFGWSGRLSMKERRKAAQELSQALSELTRQSASQGISISFRIITHSHGGNVALHLAEFFTDTPPFTIDELILLACPVQKKTELYVAHPLFRTVWSIHSHIDVIQRMDPQGLYSFLESLHSTGLEFTLSHLRTLGPLFSLRHFTPSPNLRQLHVKYPSRDLFHIEFILGDFIRSLPALIRYMNDDQPSEKHSHQEITYIIPPITKT